MRQENIYYPFHIPEASYEGKLPSECKTWAPRLPLAPAGKMIACYSINMVEHVISGPSRALRQETQSIYHSLQSD